MISFDFARLMPPGLAVEGVEYGEAGMTVLTRREAVRDQCPDCGAGSARVHSRYIRRLDDLPIGGRGVRLQYDGYLRREETNASLLAMTAEGASIKDIRRKTGHSRKLIRSVLRGQRSDIFRTRQSSLEPWLPWLDEQWAAGRQNGSELWRDPRKLASTDAFR